MNEISVFYFIFFLPYQYIASLTKSISPKEERKINALPRAKSNNMSKQGGQCNDKEESVMNTVIKLKVSPFPPF